VGEVADLVAGAPHGANTRLASIAFDRSKTPDPPRKTDAKTRRRGPQEVTARMAAKRSRTRGCDGQHVVRRLLDEHDSPHLVLHPHQVRNGKDDGPRVGREPPPGRLAAGQRAVDLAPLELVGPRGHVLEVLRGSRGDA
jgi:hypothetical protein